MGAKQTYGAVGRGDTLNFEPESLGVITDPKHPLYDPRVEKPIDEAMVLSIMRRGIIVPLVIARDGDKPYVVDGRQRRLNAIEANKRLKKAGGEPVVLPCVWKRGEDALLYEIAVTTNELRTGDSPLERAKKMQHLVDIAGYTPDALGVTFGCTVATVKNTLALLECAPQVQKAVESGTLAAIHATKLSKLSKEEQVETLGKMVEAGATKGSRAQKAVSKKGDVGPKSKALSNKIRTRVFEALESVPTAQKDEPMNAALATFAFLGGDTSAFKRWPHIENLIVQALMPVVKEKKLRVKKEKKVKSAGEKKTRKARAAERAAEATA